MKKIAVTGGLASGKTSVCRIFEEFGAYVVSADEIVHQLLSLKTAVGQQVVNLLSSDIVDNGRIDRRKIAEMVFSHPQKLKALEKIIHPAVLDEIEKCFQKIKKEPNYNLFVAEIPLLYESESTGHYYYDAIIAVTADPTLCRQRFQEASNYPAEEYDRRMAFQMPVQQKAAQADFTIVNNGGQKELKNQVLSILKELRSK